MGSLGCTVLLLGSAGSWCESAVGEQTAVFLGLAGYQVISLGDRREKERLASHHPVD